MTIATQPGAISDSVRSFLDAGSRRMLIGDEWVSAQSGAEISSLDPANGDRSEKLAIDFVA